MEPQGNISSQAPMSSQAPRVSKAEISKWENDFKEKVSPLVKFDKQDNGYSMKFYNGESGIDSYWSGTIVLKSDNYLKWNFSITNGIFIDCKMNLDENNQKITANLYDFFKFWQAEVSKAITEPKEDQANPTSAEPTPDLSGPESNNAPEEPQGPPPIPSLAEGLIITSRISKSRKETIMDSSERMRRLAGLK